MSRKAEAPVQTLTNRNEVPQEYTWNLDSIFSSNEQWENDAQRLQQRLPELASFQGTLSQSGEKLLEMFQKRDELYREVERLYVYASMRRDEDTTHSVYQAMADKAMQLYIKTSTVSSFIQPEILAIPQEQLERFVKETSGLELYQHELDDLNRQRAHVRSAEVEAILAAASEIADAPDTIFSMIDNADLKLPKIHNEQGEEVDLTKGNYQVFVRSTDRRVRQEAFEALQGAFLKQRNTIASTLYGKLKSDSFFTQQQYYQNSRERALSAYNIPESVYDNLISSVSENIPLLNRYLRLRKKILKLDSLHMYDLYVPIVEEIETQMSYAQARDTVLAALAPLGEQYVNNLRRAFDERWIDVYETPGKRGGAYSGGAYATNPFILLNFQNNRDSMYTLAQELGHSMHSYFTRTTQPFVYGSYTIFVAEVASTLNEALLTEHLLKTTSDRQERLAILNHSLEGLRGTLFRQTMFAEFEQQIHSRAEAGEPMTADVLSGIYYALNEKYYGGEVNVDKLIEIEWARIPHFYSSFYVYQYATGISASSALAQGILTEGQPAVDRYLSFLRSGGSDYSIELLKKAGVDMTSPEPVRQAFALFESHLKQMEDLLS